MWVMVGIGLTHFLFGREVYIDMSFELNWVGDVGIIWGDG